MGNLIFEDKQERVILRTFAKREGVNQWMTLVIHIPALPETRIKINYWEKIIIKSKTNQHLKHQYYLDYHILQQVPLSSLHLKAFSTLQVRSV